VLILTRRIGEAIVVGDDVLVTVLSIKGNQVRIGIQAPPSVSVDREEIHELKVAEREGRKSPHQVESPAAVTPPK